MVEPSESSTSVPEEHEPASPAYRPPFARGYPRDPALDRLLDAFLKGNHALVFEQAPELARSTHDPEIARAALDLHRRLRPDPLALAMLGGTGALLLLLSLWFYAHRHGHLPPPPRRPLRAPPHEVQLAAGAHGGGGRVDGSTAFDDEGEYELRVQVICATPGCEY
jgi:hypothetical protein